MIIGITGGTGCGKTSLLQCIAQLGGMVLDCDAIYHQLLENDPALLARIEARFPGVVHDGKLNRKVLGQIVFSDPKSLQDLNSLTHSAVKAQVLRHLEAAPALAAIDAIGLFEGQLDALCDITVAVTAPREDRICRLMARDGISREYAEKRIDAQHDSDWFIQHCDYVLENSTTQDAFQNKCLAFFLDLGIMKEKT